MDEPIENSQKIKIAEYDYVLPDSKIAKFPLEKRSNSKLLVFNQNIIAEDIYENIATYIPENSLLMFNNTKVVEARILFEQYNSKPIEIFCLEPVNKLEIATAMLSKNSVKWHCLIGGASRMKTVLLNKVVEKDGESFNFYAKKIERKDDAFVIEFTWDKDNFTFAEVLHQVGLIPLPPYLNRKSEKSDAERYQTVYAKTEGSVAAPTAGLHFTDEVINNILNRGISIDYVTLHVGAGTFKPVKSETIAEHTMHAEWIDVGIDTIENLLNEKYLTTIVVGTTSLRTIESLYWMGVKAYFNNEIGIAELEIKQWDAYFNYPKSLSKKEALEALLNWMNRSNYKKIVIQTQIMIVPGYTLKIANAIITNFHQPKSTLLLLIASIVGAQWKYIYQHALDNEYRFLSYGDGCLLWNNFN